MSAPKPDIRAREQARRVRELDGMTRAALARHFRSISGWVGGASRPETWTKDELIHDIVQIEFPGQGATS